MAAMSTKKREVIWSGRIMGAKVRAEAARQDARKAVRAKQLKKAGIEPKSVMRGEQVSVVIVSDPDAQPSGVCAGYG